MEYNPVINRLSFPISLTQGKSVNRIRQSIFKVIDASSMGNKTPLLASAKFNLNS